MLFASDGFSLAPPPVGPCPAGVPPPVAPIDPKPRCVTALNEKFGEIKDVSLLSGEFASDHFSTIAWCQIRDGEGQLFHIAGSAAEVTLTPLQPEGQDLQFIEYQGTVKLTRG